MRATISVFAVFLTCANGQPSTEEDPSQLTNTMAIATRLTRELRALEARLDKEKEDFLTVLRQLPSDYHYIERPLQNAIDTGNRARDARCSLYNSVVFPEVKLRQRATTAATSISYCSCQIDELTRLIELVASMKEKLREEIDYLKFVNSSDDSKGESSP